MSWKWLAQLPNTQAMLATGILLALATGTRVVAIGWEPPETWLWFIAALCGIATGGVLGKRMTDIEYAEAKQPPPLISTSTLTQPDGTVSETVTRTEPGV